MALSPAKALPKAYTGAPVLCERSEASEVWSKCAWVHKTPKIRSLGSRALRIAPRCVGFAGPGSITQTSPRPRM